MRILALPRETIANIEILADMGRRTSLGQELAQGVLDPLFLKVVEGHFSVSVDEDSGQSYSHAVILLRCASVPPGDRPDKQCHQCGSHTKSVQRIKRDDSLDLIAGNDWPECFDVGVHNRIQSQV